MSKVEGNAGSCRNKKAMSESESERSEGEKESLEKFTGPEESSGVGVLRVLISRNTSSLKKSGYLLLSFAFS